MSRWNLTLTDAERERMDAVRKPAETYAHLTRRALDALEAGPRDARLLDSVRTILRLVGDPAVKLLAIEVLLRD